MWLLASAGDVGTRTRRPPPLRTRTVRDAPSFVAAPTLTTPVVRGILPALSLCAGRMHHLGKPLLDAVPRRPPRDGRRHPGARGVPRHARRSSKTGLAGLCLPACAHNSAVRAHVCGQSTLCSSRGSSSRPYRREERPSSRLASSPRPPRPPRPSATTCEIGCLAAARSGSRWACSCKRATSTPSQGAGDAPILYDCRAACLPAVGPLLAL